MQLPMSLRGIAESAAEAIGAEVADEMAEAIHEELGDDVAEEVQAEIADEVAEQVEEVVAEQVEGLWLSKSKVVAEEIAEAVQQAVDEVERPLRLSKQVRALVSQYILHLNIWQHADCVQMHLTCRCQHRQFPTIHAPISEDLSEASRCFLQSHR